MNGVYFGSKSNMCLGKVLCRGAAERPQPFLVATPCSCLAPGEAASCVVARAGRERFGGPHSALLLGLQFPIRFFFFFPKAAAARRADTFANLSLDSAATPTTVSPSARPMDLRKIGVLGGGQLGRMMAEAAHRLVRRLCLKSCARKGDAHDDDIACGGGRASYV